MNKSGPISGPERQKKLFLYFAFSLSIRTFAEISAQNLFILLLPVSFDFFRLI